MSNSDLNSKSKKKKPKLSIGITIFLVSGFFMRIFSESIHELLGHGMLVLLFGYTIERVHISLLWPYGRSMIYWEVMGVSDVELILIYSGGIIACLLSSILIYSLLLKKNIRWEISMPLFWIGFWSLLNASGYLIMGGIQPYGDIQALLSLGILNQIHYLLIGILIFVIGFFTTSAVLRHIFHSFFEENAKWGVVLFWFVMPLTVTLMILGRNFLSLPLIAGGFLPVIISYLYEIEIRALIKK